MAGKSDETRSLEMRVAELEDKLQQLHITEDEMATYHKVASALGGGGGGVAASADAATALTPVPDNCVVACTVRPCTIVNQCIRQCTVVNQCIRQCTVLNCIRACTIINQCQCINECGGGWGGGFSGGGSFGGLGG
jgi:hypothetical protein